MYDQMGFGESTHFPDRKGDTALWNLELFMAELDNLKQALGIQTFDLLGHSWGGMLAAQVRLMFILIYYSLVQKLRVVELLGICGPRSSRERPSAVQLPYSDQENPILIM
jgi:pimeloyl-ACP methyl ester carboxylesterase